MDQFIEEVNEDTLNFILCFYSNNVIYHGYNPKDDSLDTGQMLSLDALKAIFTFVNENPDLQVVEYGFKSIIPSNVVQFSNKSKSIIWTTPEQERTLLFMKNLSIPTGRYRVPAMLWKLNGKSLQVFALDPAEPISEKTKLYNAPFLNVNATGTVCMGSAHFENKHVDYNMIIKDAEAKFFNSYFTHSHNNLLLDKTNYVDYCTAVVDRNIFDNKLLVPSGKTIKSIL